MFVGGPGDGGLAATEGGGGGLGSGGLTDMVGEVHTAHRQKAQTLYVLSRSAEVIPLIKI